MLDHFWNFRIFETIRLELRKKNQEDNLMVWNNNGYNFANVYLFTIFIFLTLGIIPGSIYAKQKIEVRMEKYEKLIYKYEKSKDINKLIITMFALKRDVGNYLGQGIDEKSSINHDINGIIEEIMEKIPELKLSKEDIDAYKYLIYNINRKLPADFWLERDHDSIIQRPMDVGVSPSFDLAITCTLCGGFIYMVPHPACKTIGLTLMAFGSEKTVTAITQKMDEDKRKNRDCSQCSKKCRDCPYCRKRYNLR